MGSHHIDDDDGDDGGSYDDDDRDDDVCLSVCARAACPCRCALQEPAAGAHTWQADPQAVEEPADTLYSVSQLQLLCFFSQSPLLLLLLAKHD